MLAAGFFAKLTNDMSAMLVLRNDEKNDSSWTNVFPARCVYWAEMRKEATERLVISKLFLFGQPLYRNKVHTPWRISKLSL